MKKIKVDPKKVIDSKPEMVKEGFEISLKPLWQIITSPFRSIYSLFDHPAHNIHNIKNPE